MGVIKIFGPDSEVKICRKLGRSKILPHKGPCDEVQWQFEVLKRFGGEVGTLELRICT